MCLFLGIAFSGVVVSVSGQSTKTGDDSSQGSVWVNNSILEETPYVNAEKVENLGIIEAATPDNVPFYFFNTKYFTNFPSEENPYGPLSTNEIPSFVFNLINIKKR